MQQEIENSNFKTMTTTCTKAASTRLEAPRALLNCKHGLFHIRYFENGLWSKGREMSDLKKKNWLEKWKVFMLEA